MTLSYVWFFVCWKKFINYIYLKGKIKPVYVQVKNNILEQLMENNLYKSICISLFFLV